MTGVVAYFRVSTKRQGASGLGLEGQQVAVETHAHQAGLPILARYLEVESGRRTDRPQLARALAHARRSKATLVVAKLDRLSRNLAFLSALMESKVPIVCCDNPAANELTLQILAAIAQYEAKAISERTKAALAAYKARGGKLGSARAGHWNGREDRRLVGLEKARRVARKVVSERAAEAYSDLLPVITGLKAEGSSLRQIAERLNAQGHTTRRGKPWNPVQVARVLRRSK